MMKAAILLLAMAVAVNGLGFPNFNLGCPFAQANRFTADQTTGVIPYCRVANGQFVDDLSSLLAARPGYTPVYEPTANWVIIRPEVPLSMLDAVNAFPGILVSVGMDAQQQFADIEAQYNQDNTIGTEIAFTFPGCSMIDTTNMAGGSFGIGLSQQIACPAANILGKFEFANQAGASNQGNAQSLTLPRPYIFYGL
jgi:hypothetical protein